MPWLVAVILVGFGLRAFGLGQDSLWYDEGGSIYYASQPIGNIAANAIGDAHPPLYFYLQHLWMGAVGTREYAARYASLMPSVATTAALYPIGRRLGGPALGLSAAAAWTLSPFGVYLAREVRMYALLGLLSVLSTYAVLRLLERPTPGRAALYAASAIGLFYLHYFGPVLLAGHAAIVFWRRDRRTFALWVAAVAFAAALFLPWLLRVWAQVGDFASGDAGTDPWRVIRSTATAFASGYPPERLDERRVDDPLLSPLLPLVAGALVVVGMRRAVAAAWLLGALVAVLALVAGRADFTPRYLTVAAPAFALALGSGLLTLWRLRRSVAVAAGVALAALTGSALYRQYADARLWHEDFRSAVAHLAIAERPGQAVVLDPGYMAPVYDFYALGRWPTIGLPAGHPLDARPRLESVVGQHGFVWLVLWQEYHADPDGSVERWLGERAERVDERRFRGDVRVVGYATGR